MSRRRRNGHEPPCRQIAGNRSKRPRNVPITTFPFRIFAYKNTTPAPATDLSPGYETAGMRTVREQLMKAGVRLAAALEQYGHALTWRTHSRVPRSHSCERVRKCAQAFAGVRTRQARVLAPH